MSRIEIVIAVINDGHTMGVATFPDEVGAFNTTRDWVLDGFTVEAHNDEGQVIVDLVMEDLDAMFAEAEFLASDIEGAIARGDLIPLEEAFANIA